MRLFYSTGKPYADPFRTLVMLFGILGLLLGTLGFLLFGSFLSTGAPLFREKPSEALFRIIIFGILVGTLYLPLC